LSAQQVAALPRYHHQWLPDLIEAEAARSRPTVKR
jgi:gamma-glutamyltranspeptidase/glutathione hydrolase